MQHTPADIRQQTASSLTDRSATVRQPRWGLLVLAVQMVTVLLTTGSYAQTNLAPNADLATTATGSSSCLYTWENDGPCAPEYFVQQYPDEAFAATLVTIGDPSDNVFAVHVLDDEPASFVGDPRVSFKYPLTTIQAGEVYDFSVAVHTAALRFDTRLKAVPKGASGAIPGASVVVEGPRQTAPWQRVGLQVEVPVDATSIDFVIEVRGSLGQCGVIEDGVDTPCGSAYFDDLSIIQVDNLAPNASFDTWTQGNPPCLYNWENDGPCAQEYLVQQYPDEAFVATLTSLDNDSVYAVEALVDDCLTCPSTPRTNLKYTLTGIEPGEIYAFSTSVHTEALHFGTSLRATPRGVAGAITEAKVIQPGPTGTSPWQRVGLEIRVPEEATSIDFSIYVSDSPGDCVTASCGFAYFDDLSITRVRQHAFTNACPEGWYVDASDGGHPCKQLEVDLAQLAAHGVDSELETLHTGSSGSSLDPTRIFGGSDVHVGFKPNAFAAAFALAGLRDDHFELTACTEVALQDLLDQVELNGGGTVTLPACEIAIGGTLQLPSRVIFQGAGIGRTILHPADPWSNNRLFDLLHIEHVIVRDLTVDGLHRIGTNDSTFGFRSLEVDNVLIERVEVKDFRLNAFLWERSLNFTVRHSAAYGNSGHAYATFDCDTDLAVTVDGCLGDVDSSYLADFGRLPTWYWVANHAVYSNHVTDNVKSGVNSHGILAEIAGNRIINNSQGSKFSHLRYFWVHDNLYQDAKKKGLRVQAVTSYFRQPRHLLLYRNRFIGNGSSYQGWIENDPPLNFINLTFLGGAALGRANYLIHNYYEDNLGRITGFPVDPLCEGLGSDYDEVSQYPVYVPPLPTTAEGWQHRVGFVDPPLPDDHAFCELANVNDVFFLP